MSEGRRANGANLAGAPRMEWFDEGGLREAAAAACGELDAALREEAPLAADHGEGFAEERKAGASAWNEREGPIHVDPMRIKRPF